MSACTEKCRTPVNCTTCGKRKAPIGRDVGAEAASGYCDWECPGYHLDPKPGHLFPGESLNEDAERTIAAIIERLKP